MVGSKGNSPCRNFVNDARRAGGSAGPAPNCRSRQCVSSRMASAISSFCFISSIGFREIKMGEACQEPLFAPGQSGADGFRVHVSRLGDFPKRKLAEKMKMNEITI